MTDTNTKGPGMNSLELAAQIVSAYVSNNNVPSDELPKLIARAHEALLMVSMKPPGATIPMKEPAVPIRQSVRASHLTCLECGQEFKMLKRHLATDHGLTPSDYRQRWGLQSDYPIIAPDYSKKRSGIARQVGLGQKRRVE